MPSQISQAELIQVGPAPVLAKQAPAAPGLVARLRGGDRWRSDHGPELPAVEQVLLDQPAADLLRQVRQGERRQRGPGRDRRPAPAGFDLVEEEAAALVVEPLDQRRSDRGPPQGLEREAPEHVDDRSQSSGPPRSSTRPASKPSRRLCATSSGNPSRPPIFQPHTGSNFGRGVESGLVRLQDPQQAVAVEIAVRGQPVGLRRDPGLRGRVADGDPPGPGEQRRLDRLGLHRAARADVVEGKPRP